MRTCVRGCLPRYYATTSKSWFERELSLLTDNGHKQTEFIKTTQFLYKIIPTLYQAEVCRLLSSTSIVQIACEVLLTGKMDTAVATPHALQTYFFFRTTTSPTSSTRALLPRSTSTLFFSLQRQWQW